MKTFHCYDFDTRRGNFVERVMYQEDPQIIWHSRRKQRAREALREWWREFRWQLAYALFCLAIFGGLYLIATTTYGG